MSKRVMLIVINLKKEFIISKNIHMENSEFPYYLKFSAVFLLYKHESSLKHFYKRLI